MGTTLFSTYREDGPGANCTMFAFSKAGLLLRVLHTGNQVSRWFAFQTFKIMQ